MKNIAFKIIVVLALIQLIGCTKYEPLYDVNDIVISAPIVYQRDGIYIHNNDIYLTDELLKTHKRLTNSPTSKKTHCKITNTHDKIAYIDANQIPVVIDTNGVELYRLTQFANANDLGWHNGDQTLYVLVNNELKFYGQALALSNPLFTTFPTTNTSSTFDNYMVHSIAINAALDVVYTYTYTQVRSTNTSGTHVIGVAIDFKNPSSTDLSSDLGGGLIYAPTKPLNTQNYYFYTSVRFSYDSQVELLRAENLNRTLSTSYKQYKWEYKTRIAPQLQLTGAPALSIYQNKGVLYMNENSMGKRLSQLPSGAPPATALDIPFTFSIPNQNIPVYFDWNPTI